MDNVQRALPFSRGQSVMHADFGSCTVMGIETVKRGGHSVEVYVLHFSRQKMTMEIPTKGTGTEKLRTISSAVTPTHIVAILQKSPRARSKQMWSRRAKDWAEDIRSGDITRVAGVVNQLYPGSGSYSELQLYQEALHMVCGELSLMTGKTEAEVVSYLTQQCEGKLFKLTSYTPYSTAKSGGKKYTPPPEELGSKKDIPWSASQHLPQKKGEPPKKRRVTQPKTASRKPLKETPGMASVLKPQPVKPIIITPPVRPESVRVVAPVIKTVVEPQAPSPMSKVPPEIPVVLKKEAVQPAIVTANTTEMQDRITALTEELAAEKKATAELAKDHERIVREVEARAARATAKAERAETTNETLRGEARHNRTVTRLQQKELADDVETERGRIRALEKIIAELKENTSPEVWAAKEAEVKALKRDLQSVRAQYTMAKNRKSGLKRELEVARKDLAGALKQLSLAETLSTSSSLSTAEAKNKEALTRITSLNDEIAALEQSLKDTTRLLLKAQKVAETERGRTQSLKATLRQSQKELKATKQEDATAVAEIMARIEEVRTELLSDIAKRVTNSDHEKKELARLQKLLKDQLPT